MTPRARSARAIPSRARGVAHRPVAAPAVDVDVDESGRDERTSSRRLRPARPPRSGRPRRGARRRDRSSRTSRPRIVSVIGGSPSPLRSPRRASLSAPWIAAPIAPAQIPSSAMTTSTSSSDVVWTRRRSSARIGLQQQVAGRGDAAADHDPIRREERDHVGDADTEVASDRRPALHRGRIASPCRRDGSLRGRRSRKLRRSDRPG